MFTTYITHLVTTSTDPALSWVPSTLRSCLCIKSLIYTRPNHPAMSCKGQGWLINLAASRCLPAERKRRRHFSVPYIPPRSVIQYDGECTRSFSKVFIVYGWTWGGVNRCMSSGRIVISHVCVWATTKPCSAGPLNHRVFNSGFSGDVTHPVPTWVLTGGWAGKYPWYQE